MLRRGRQCGSASIDVHATAYLRHLCAFVGLCLRDQAQVWREATELGEFADKHRLRMRQALAACYRGWLATEEHRPCDAVEESSSTKNMAPLFMAGRARALAGAGRTEEAVKGIERAIAECMESEQLWCSAELWRARGEVLLSDGARDVVEAIHSYEHALAVARSQGSGLWELRTAMSLACLKASLGQHADALRLLNPVCQSYSEGLDTVDIDDARTLLHELTPDQTPVEPQRS